MQSFMDWFRTQKGIDNIVSSALVKLWKQSDEYKRQQANFISSNQLVIKSLPSEPTDIEVLLELHHHLDICGHNINSNLKERLREMIKRGNVL